MKFQRVLRRIGFKIISLLGIRVTYRNIYGARMVLYKDYGAIYVWGKGERGTLDFIAKNLKDGDVFVDVGAYVGFFTIFASKIVGERGKILAFEPNPTAYSILLENLKLNGCKNVKAFNFALGSKEGWGFLKVKGISSDTATFLYGKGDLKVRIRKLDEVLKEEGIIRVDMVKIDVVANLKAYRFNPIHSNIIFIPK